MISRNFLAAAPTSGIFGQSPSSGTPSNIFGGGVSKPNESSTPTTSVSAGGIFGGKILDPLAAKPENNLSSDSTHFADLSASKNLASFADLGAGGGFSFGKKTEGFSFAGTGGSVFGKKYCDFTKDRIFLKISKPVWAKAASEKNVEE